MYRLTIPLIAAVGLALAGCKKKETAQAQPLPPEQVPATMENAFHQAKPEVRQIADQVASTAAADAPTAFYHVEELTKRTDLTADERAAALRTEYSLLEQMRQNAENGDKKSQEALKKYRASK